MSVSLAIEWSTRRLSVATQRDEERPRESDLTVERFHGPDAMGLLEGHLEAQGVAMCEISGIVVGRGPGNFSGIRLAFAWAAGCMAPGGVTLRAYSSGRVMARRLAEEISDFWVLGDARRGVWWGCEVQSGAVGAWVLNSPGEWRERIGPGVVFSSEAGRLEGLKDLREAYPQAAELLHAEDKSENPQPLYLHPAV